MTDSLLKELKKIEGIDVTFKSSSTEIEGFLTISDRFKVLYLSGYDHDATMKFADVKGISRRKREGEVEQDYIIKGKFVIT